MCLPSPCFIRTVIFPIYHWYSWCLRPSHLLTFPANYGPPTSYENLWPCLETTETSGPSVCPLLVPLNYLSAGMPGLHILYTVCMRVCLLMLYCTSAVGGQLTLTGASIKCVVIHSAKHYLTVITGIEPEQRVIWAAGGNYSSHIYVEMIDRQRWTWKKNLFLNHC